MKTHAGTYPLRLPKTQYPEFCDRLKVAMDVRHYSVLDLATSIYTSESTISMYRCGRRLPSLDVLCLIAKELQVSTDFLLGMTDIIYV